MKIRNFMTIGATLAFVISGSAYSQETQLTVYTAVEAVDLDRYAKEFEAAHPEIKINWVRNSNGIMTAKLLAEKNNPVADVVWGMGATSLLFLKADGMFEPYQPAGIENLDPRFRDSENPPHWVGMDAYLAAICFNTAEAARLGILVPTKWEDLLRSEYKGHIVMANAASSGTGFLHVSAWLQIFGEEKGWEFMDGLHQNIDTYTHSGAKPCKMAGAGEAVVGISFEFTGVNIKDAGGPIDIIFPEEGLGWEMEASAIIAGTQNLEAAKTLIDWSITKEANIMYNKSWAVVGYKGLARSMPYLPDNLPEMMIDNDLDWAANNRTNIIDEWSRRYDIKSEPKQ